MPFHRFFAFSLLAFSVCFAGCGGSSRPADLPNLHPTTVTITQGGVPLPEAVILLMPADGSKWNAGGNTDSSGKAVLTTHGLYPGVAAGKYKVLVTKNETISPPTRPSGDPTPQEPSKTYMLVEEKYSDAEKTPLAVEVTAAGPNNFPLDAGKAVRDLMPAR